MNIDSISSSEVASKGARAPNLARTRAKQAAGQSCDSDE